MSLLVTRRSAMRMLGIGVGIMMLTERPASAQTDHVVEILSGPHRFEPAEVTVKAGDTVKWINKANIDHTVTPDNAGALEGKDPIPPNGEHAEVIKASAEPIGYFCRIHPNMKGKIIVSE